MSAAGGCVPTPLHLASSEKTLDLPLHGVANFNYNDSCMAISYNYEHVIIVATHYL